MTENTTQLVLDGYNQVADKYFTTFGASKVREKWASRLISRLPGPGAQVLDLGCGAGLPVAQDFCAAGHHVTGVDGSEAQIAKAKANVPDASFILADMTKLQLKEASFDGIGAFYSITHLPANEQIKLIGKVSEWLKPGGVFVASFGAGGAGSWTGEWLGVPMFFDQNEETATLECLRSHGLVIMRSEIEMQDNEATSFLWVEAIKD